MAIAVSAAEQSSAAEYAATNDHLSVGDGGHAFAMAYDWLWPYLTGEQRKLLRDKVEDFGAWLYRCWGSGKTYPWYTPRELSCNHNPVVDGGLDMHTGAG